MPLCCCSSSTGKAAIIVALISAAGVIGAAKFVTNDSNAQEAEVIPASQPEQPEMPTPEQMMAMMAEWAAPVAEHEHLKAMVGTWDAHAEFMMEGPGGEVTTGKGTSESALILGGRFATQHFTMPDFMGTDFEGYGAVGYDKAKGKYVNVWLDNFGTGVMMMEGEHNEDTNTTVWKGNAVYPDGMGGTAQVPVKHVIKHHGEDKYVMEFWEPNPATGEMMNNGTITYTRRK